MSMKDTNTNKTILRVLLAALVVLLFCGAAVGAVAGDGTTSFPGPGTVPAGTYTGGDISGEYTLGGNVILTSGLNVTGSCTINLNGYVLSRSTEDGTLNFSVITVSSTGNLTIRDVVDVTTGNTKPHYFKIIFDGGLPKAWSWDSLKEGQDQPEKCIELNAITSYDNDKTGGWAHKTGDSYDYAYVEVPGGCITGGTGTSGSSDGTFIHGGGVYVVGGGQFTLESGNIIGNSATGNDNADKRGGGVCVYGNGSEFIMTGGTIAGNGAKPGDNGRVFGGGVFVRKNGTFEMSGTASIVGNIATAGGGGVRHESGMFEMSGSASIRGNSAGSSGGGVFVGADPASFKISGTASIVGNIAKDNGGGVGVAANQNCTFNVSGAPVIKDNKISDGSVNNVYLPDENRLTVTGALKDTASGKFAEIGIVNPASGKFGAGTANYTVTAADAACFFKDSNNQIHGVVKNTNELHWGAVAKIVTSGATPENTYYTTVADAVSAAGTGGIGTVITMIDNSTEPTVVVDKTVTLDLNGYVLENNGTAKTVKVDDTDCSSMSVLFVASGGNLTVTDGTATKHYFKYNSAAKWEKTDTTSETPISAFDLSNAMSGSSVYYVEGGCITGGTGTDISDKHHGGGIYVDIGGNFTLDSGNIIGNSADYFGGGVVATKGMFTMKAGNIVGNTAYMGGGVCVLDGKFTMEGGSITGNTATGPEPTMGGGVFVMDGEFTLDKGNIIGNTAYMGGGVCVLDGKFTMKAGSITGNIAFMGGGVNVTGTADIKGIFTMSENASIKGNNAANGGGVYVAQYGKFTMENGTVGGSNAGDGNTATNGGGVYVKNGMFTMEDGSITGNTATNGGGVYVDDSDSSMFTMNGGTISGNSATGYGGGVCVKEKFNVSGNPIIRDNKKGTDANNVHLEEASNLNLAGPFTGDIYVNSPAPSSGTSPVQFGIVDSEYTTVTEADATHFKSDETLPDGSHYTGTLTADKKQLVWGNTEPAPKTGKLTVVVKKDSETGSGVSDADVKLGQGNNKGLYSGTTDSYGNATFDKVQEGAYNVVVTATIAGKEKTITEAAEVIGDDTQTVTVIVPTQDVSSKVEIKKDTPKVVVSGVNKEAIKQATDGSSVDVTVTVEAKKDVPDSDIKEDIAKIKNIAEGRTLEYLAISVKKTVTKSGEDPKVSKIKSTTETLEFLIPYDFTGKYEVTLYRCHKYEDGREEVKPLKKLDSIPTGDKPEEGSFYLDEGKGMIHLYGGLFSTYSMGYLTEPPAPKKSSSTPSGSSTWLQEPVPAADEKITSTDVTAVYAGIVFIPATTVELRQIEAVNPAYAELISASLKAAENDGISLTNSKGAKVIITTPDEIPGIQKEVFAQVIDVESADGSKVTSVPFKVRLSDLAAKILTTDDVTLYHYLEEYGLWIPLETGLVSTDDVYAYYEAATDGASPFGVLLKKLDAPEVKPLPSKTPAGKSPVPFMGVLAGLGAAAVVFAVRMRR